MRPGSYCIYIKATHKVHIENLTREEAYAMMEDTTEPGYGIGREYQGAYYPTTGFNDDPIEE